MRALSDLVGLPVVKLDNGEVVGEIDQVHWNVPAGDISGITVNCSHGAFFIPYETIDRVGQDAVFVKDASPTNDQSHHQPRSLNGMIVYDHDGNELGNVDDLMVDLAHGKVSGLNVSGGLLRDIVQGRQFVPLQSAQLGKDAIIVESVLDNREDGK